MKAKPLPPIDRLRRLLEYDSEAGILTWKVRSPEDFTATEHHSAERLCRIWNRRYAGKLASSKAGGGYLNIKIDGRAYRAHRIAWAIHSGNDPVLSDIDHRNRDRGNIKFNNLRPATRSENTMNAAPRLKNKSGVLGVCPHKATGKWIAQIQCNGKKKYLGIYDSIDAAAKARREAEKKFYGEFAFNACT